MSEEAIAQEKSVVASTEFDLKELKEIPQKKKVKECKIRDADGKYIVKVNMSNFREQTTLKVGSMPYNQYPQWKNVGWASDQWDAKKFPLQSKMYKQATEKSGDQFYDMNKQYTYDVVDMPLEPLDIEKDIMDDFTVLLIGRRRSGKTFASRFIMYHLRHRFPMGIVITGTKLNNYWSQYIPEEFIFSVDDLNKVIDMVFARQTYIISNPQLGIDPRIFIIYDDVLTDKYALRFSKELGTAFTNGRHYKILSLINVQDCKGIPPDLRENTDCAVIFRVYEGGRKEIVEKEWLSYVHNIRKKKVGENGRAYPPRKLQGKVSSTINLREEGEEEEDEDRDKITTVGKFFWKNTGLMDKNTCTNFKETRDTTDEDRDEAIPQAIAILQARTTENLQMVFKRVVAEDPGPFVLGDYDYYNASQSGRWRSLYGTYRKFKRRARRRINKDNVLPNGEHHSDSESGSESSD
jgi:hypothetical protein